MSGFNLNDFERLPNPDAHGAAAAANDSLRLYNNPQPPQHNFYGPVREKIQKYRLDFQTTCNQQVNQNWVLIRKKIETDSRNFRSILKNLVVVCESKCTAKRPSFLHTDVTSGIWFSN